MGDGLSYSFIQNVDGSFSPPTGIHDSLVQNADGTYTLTKPDQTAYHFKTNLYCDSISDENDNTITISYNTGNYVTSISDPTSRTISLTYDGSNRIHTITDPLSRVWTLAYDASNNLQTVTLPTLGSSSFHWTLDYNTAHDITTLTSPGSRSQTFTDNSSDNSLTTETDGAGNTRPGPRHLHATFASSSNFSSESLGFNDFLMVVLYPVLGTCSSSMC